MPTLADLLQLGGELRENIALNPHGYLGGRCSGRGRVFGERDGLTMIRAVIIIIVVLIALALVKGLIRWVLLVAAIAFGVFFLRQPAHVTPAVRAKIAASEVVKDGQAAGTTVLHSKIVISNWQKLEYFARKDLGI